jgi:hypothetical protein
MGATLAGSGELVAAIQQYEQVSGFILPKNYVSI